MNYLEITEHNNFLENILDNINKNIIDLENNIKANKELLTKIKSNLQLNIYTNFVENIFEWRLWENVFDEHKNILSLHIDISFENIDEREINIETYNYNDKEYKIKAKFDYKKIFDIDEETIKELITENETEILESADDTNCYDRDCDNLYGSWSEGYLFSLEMNNNWITTEDINHDIYFLKLKGPKFLCLASKNLELKDEDFKEEICIPNSQVYEYVDSINVITEIKNNIIIKQNEIDNIIKRNYSKESINKRSSQEITKLRNKIQETITQAKFNKAIITNIINRYKTRNWTIPEKLEFLNNDEDEDIDEDMLENILELCPLFKFLIVDGKKNQDYFKNFYLHYFMKYSKDKLEQII